MRDDFEDPVGLPNIEQRRVDLFSAETGAMLSWIDYFKIENNFLTPCHVEINQAGYIVFIQADGSQIKMTYDKKMFTARTKSIHFDELDNKGLHSVWGDSLTQVIIYNEDCRLPENLNLNSRLIELRLRGKNFEH